MIGQRVLYSDRAHNVLANIGFTFYPWLNKEVEHDSPGLQMWLLWVCRIAKGQVTFHTPTGLRRFLQTVGPAHVDLEKEIIYILDRPYKEKGKCK